MDWPVPHRNVALCFSDVAKKPLPTQLWATQFIVESRPLGVVKRRHRREGSGAPCRVTPLLAAWAVGAHPVPFAAACGAVERVRTRDAPRAELHHSLNASRLAIPRTRTHLGTAPTRL